MEGFFPIPETIEETGRKNLSKIPDFTSSPLLSPEVLKSITVLGT